MQPRNRYILYKKLNPSPIYMLLGISDRAKQGVGGKCKKNKYKMQECTPGNATCCAESWINPQSTCCSTSAGAEHKRSKKGVGGKCKCGDKKQMCRAAELMCWISASSNPLLICFLPMFDSITVWLNFCVCIFSQKLRSKDFLNYKK